MRRLFLIPLIMGGVFISWLIWSEYEIKREKKKEVTVNYVSKKYITTVQGTSEPISSEPISSQPDQTIEKISYNPVKKFTSNPLLGLEISILKDDDIYQAIITNIEPGSIAMLYGMQKDDWLVVADGEDVVWTTESDYLEKLPKIINAMENNVTENFVKRDGKFIQIYLPIIIPTDYAPTSAVLPRDADIGITVQRKMSNTIESKAGKRISIMGEDVPLYRITAIAKDSPADKSGKIQVGDLIYTYGRNKSGAADYGMQVNWSEKYFQSYILHGPKDSWLSLRLFDKDTGELKTVSLQRKVQK